MHEFVDRVQSSVVTEFAELGKQEKIRRHSEDVCFEHAQALRSVFVVPQHVEEEAYT